MLAHSYGVRPMLMGSQDPRCLAPYAYWIARGLGFKQDDCHDADLEVRQRTSLFWRRLPRGTTQFVKVTPLLHSIYLYLTLPDWYWRCGSLPARLFLRPTLRLWVNDRRLAVSIFPTTFRFPSIEAGAEDYTEGRR